MNYNGKPSSSEFTREGGSKPPASLFPSTKPSPSDPLVLCVGGEDHHLRIPFLLRLAECGFRVVAAGTGDASPFVKAGLKFRSFHFDRFVNPVADWTAIKELRGLVASLGPEVIQTFDTKPNLLVPFASRGERGTLIIRTINGLGWLYSSNSLAALALRPVYCSLQRMSARWTKASVFQNQQDKIFFEQQRMTGTGPGHLISGSGIDIKRFRESMKSGPDLEALRNELELGSCEVVVTVSRLTKQKGILALLRAAEIVHRVRPTVRFLLVGPRQGEGPFAIDQSEIDRHSTYVTALGQRSDVPAILSLADVFAFPTEYREGVPRALMEAALSRTPIVTTDMPGCSDIVKDGWSGLLVPPNAPETLAERILYLLENPQLGTAMASRAEELVTNEFGLDLVVARYADLYRELLRSQDRTVAFAG